MYASQRLCMTLLPLLSPHCLWHPILPCPAPLGLCTGVPDPCQKILSSVKMTWKLGAGSHHRQALGLAPESNLGEWRLATRLESHHGAKSPSLSLYSVCRPYCITCCMCKRHSNFPKTATKKMYRYWSSSTVTDHPLRSEEIATSPCAEWSPLQPADVWLALLEAEIVVDYLGKTKHKTNYWHNAAISCVDSPLTLAIA